MTCEEAKQVLMDSVLEEAGAEERRRVQAHLNDCPACRAQLADYNLTHKLLVQGLPEEEVPRRIAFVAGSEPVGHWRRWFSQRAFAVPLGVATVATALALLVGVLALARTRVVLERGRWEVAFGGAGSGLAPGNTGLAGRSAATPAVAGEPVFTREQAALLVAAAMRDNEARQSAQLMALVEAAARRQDQRHLAMLASLAEQMKYFERTQKIFYKEAEGTRSALAVVASRLPAEKGDRP